MFNLVFALAQVWPTLACLITFGGMLSPDQLKALQRLPAIARLGVAGNLKILVVSFIWLEHLLHFLRAQLALMVALLEYFNWKNQHICMLKVVAPLYQGTCTSCNLCRPIQCGIIKYSVQEVLDTS